MTETEAEDAESAESMVWLEYSVTRTGRAHVQTENRHSVLYLHKTPGAY